MNDARDVTIGNLSCRQWPPRERPFVGNHGGTPTSDAVVLDGTGLRRLADDSQVVALRRLLYCGEWIHSHALHIYMPECS